MTREQFESDPLRWASTACQIEGPLDAQCTGYHRVDRARRHRVLTDIAGKLGLLVFDHFEPSGSQRALDLVQSRHVGTIYSCKKMKYGYCGYLTDSCGVQLHWHALNFDGNRDDRAYLDELCETGTFVNTCVTYFVDLHERTLTAESTPTPVSIRLAQRPRLKQPKPS